MKLEFDQKRQEILREILEIFEFLKKKEREKKREKEAVLVVLARNFEENFLKEIEDRIREKFKIEKERKIDFVVDENIIGGILIKDENYIFDGTIKGALKKLWTFIKS